MNKYDEILKNSIENLRQNGKLENALEKIIKIEKENDKISISNTFKDKILGGIISNKENNDASRYSVEAKILLLQKLNSQNENPINEKLFVNLGENIKLKLGEEGVFKRFDKTIKTEEQKTDFYNKLFTEFKEKEPNDKIIDNIYGNNRLYRNNCIKIGLPKSTINNIKSAL